MSANTRARSGWATGRVSRYETPIQEEVFREIVSDKPGSFHHFEGTRKQQMTRKTSACAIFDSNDS